MVTDSMASTLNSSTQRVRRLSSATAGSDDLNDGPAVVVPPANLNLPGQAHETAASLDIAKHKLVQREINGETSTPVTPPEGVADAYAFAFDIDGVLVRGGKAIPEAVEAMKVLNGQNEFGIKM